MVYVELIKKEKIMTKQDLIRQNEIALEAFMLHGGVIVQCKPKAPRKSERVLTGTTKGSVYNTGRLRSYMRGSASVDKREF